MIKCIIWSKDRAAQLDLALSSMKHFFKEWEDQKFTIIYKYSNDNFRLGYERLKELHPEFEFVKETNFRADTIRVFNENPEIKLISFLVDDDVFVDYFSLEDPQFQSFLSNDSIMAFSPRMAPYITHCYTQWNSDTPPPTFTENLVWKWIGLKGDWGYPMSVASFHVFRRDDLSNAINTQPFKLANTFEQILVNTNPSHRPNMICYPTAKCICSTNNRVQNENSNRTENTNPISALNKTFLAGQRLSPTINQNLKLNTAHGAVNYEWN